MAAKPWKKSIILVALLRGCFSAPIQAQQSNKQPALESRKLVTLERQLKAGNAAALDDFWREIQRQGTPLLEPAADDDKSVLVTFPWRGQRNAQRCGSVTAEERGT